MKYMLIIMILLAGCSETSDSKQPPLVEERYITGEIVCFDGVKYVFSYRRLAVYISPRTFKPVPCTKTKKETKHWNQ